MSKHLDLGCGMTPKNPYLASELYGIDIRTLDHAIPGFTYRQADIAKDGIPFESEYFDSISAFDFIEHVPRTQPALPAGMRFPFVELMNEIHRTLKVGGRLYAITPCYPHRSVFTDPTHVNFITRDTHKYFCGDAPLARMYGFNGRFRAVSAARTYATAGIGARNDSAGRKLKYLRKLLKGQLSHCFWELERT